MKKMEGEGRARVDLCLTPAVVEAVARLGGRR
jgi:hypothetical protein